MEDRKKEEARFHNKIREGALEAKDIDSLTSNKKFYSITRKSVNFVNNFLVKRYRGKKVLDYCCGDGTLTIFLAKNGVNAFGIDISEISIKNAEGLAKKEGMEEKTPFFVMDAEKTTFPDNYFDAIVCSGVLHHLDTEKAFQELARILKPEGSIICGEPLAYNPIFQLYRKLTPHLRTEWEAKHILSKKDIKLAERYFGKIEKRFFHLFTLFAVPFRNCKCFKPILWVLEKIDGLVLKLPLMKWWAWQIVFILSEPKK